MKVYGYELTEAQIKICLTRMKSNPFTALDVANAAIAAGVPAEDQRRNPIAHRVADRMIQKIRRMGCLKMSPKFPVWNKLEADLKPAQFL